MPETLALTHFPPAVSVRSVIEHYVNGLTPRELPVNASLYESLARVFETCLPFINGVYSYARCIRSRVRRDQEEDTADLPEDIGDLNFRPYNLCGQKLQVITKIVDYELKPGQSHEGVWHVEGMRYDKS